MVPWAGKASGQEQKAPKHLPVPEKNRGRTAKKACKPTEQEENYEKGPRSSWARNQMGNINQLIATFAVAATAFVFAAEAADDLESLAGKWSVKKVNDQGQEYTQTISVKKDKFIFQIAGADDGVVLYAEGDLKLDKPGPFNAAHFVNIRAGKSASDLSDVDDEFVSIYRLAGDAWTVASNFDKEREHQKPSVDVYRRVQTTVEAATLVIDEIAMADTPQSATWFLCFEITVEGVTRTYHVDGKGYDKKQVTIPVGLELPKARPGQKCSFKLQLDDDDGDVCTENVDNRSTGEFAVSDKGEQAYKPEDDWRYTIRWHLK
jgi:hypothetical protein